MSIKHIAVVVAAALLQGCSTPAAKPIVKKTLDFKREHLFTVDTRGEIVNCTNYYQPAGSENVYFLDPVNCNFHVLNAPTGSLRLLGKLPGTEESDGFTVDEAVKKIYVFYTDSISIHTFDGAHVGAINYHIPQADGFIYMSSQYFPPIIRNNKLYMSFFPNVEGSFRKPEYFKSPVEAEIDLKTKKVHMLDQGYPVTYQQYCYSYNYDPERVQIDANTHGYTFPHSDSIYICNLKTDEHSVRFFGTMQPKKFQHLSYDKLGSLHESVFDELVQTNPHYYAMVSAPLAGYYFRQLISAEKGSKMAVQRMALFDKDFNYVGESPIMPNFVIDSKKGLISMRMKNNQIILDRLSW